MIVLASALILALVVVVMDTMIIRRLNRILDIWENKIEK